MFKTGTPVTGENFIDRKKHLPLFKTYIDHNQNIMIKVSFPINLAMFH